MHIGRTPFDLRTAERDGLTIRQHETARIDAMADVFRSNQDLDSKEIAQRLRALDRLREMLLAD